MRRRLNLMTVALCALTSAGVFGQGTKATPTDGPSLEDTFDFLKGALARSASVVTLQSQPGGGKKWVESVELRDCTLMVAAKTDYVTASRDDSASESSVAEIKLNALVYPVDGVNRPSSMAAGVRLDYVEGPIEIVLRTYRAEKVIAYRTTMAFSYKGRETESKTESYTASEYSLRFDIDLAPRVANALSHAIRLCGGKKQAF